MSITGGEHVVPSESEMGQVALGVNTILKIIARAINLW